VGAGAPAFVGGLEDEGAGGNGVRAGAAVDAFVEGGEEVVDGGGGLEGLGGGIGECGVGVFLEEFLAVGGLGGEEGFEADVEGRAVGFLGLEGDHALGGAFHGKAHDGLVNGADLLDIEGAVGEALAIEVKQEVEDAVQSAIRDAGELLGKRIRGGRRDLRGRGSGRDRRGGLGGRAGTFAYGGSRRGWRERG